MIYLPIRNMSNMITSEKGIIPLKVTIFGKMLNAVSALSNMYDKQVQHKILDGQ
mgnify:FL=1